MTFPIEVPEAPEPPIWHNSDTAYGWRSGWAAGYEAGAQAARQTMTTAPEIIADLRDRIQKGAQRLDSDAAIARFRDDPDEVIRLAGKAQRSSRGRRLATGVRREAAATVADKAAVAVHTANLFAEGQTNVDPYQAACALRDAAQELCSATAWAKP